MPLDYAKLRNRVFPTLTQRYTARDTILYALGVGAGLEDPLDPDELRFLYEEGLRALPTMAVVLANEGLWLRDPQYGILWKQLLHGEQMLRERISASLVPSRLAGVLDETKSAVAHAVQRLEAELSEFDPTINAAVRKSYSKIAYQLSKVERKAGREMLARDERAARDAASRQVFRSLSIATASPISARHSAAAVSRAEERKRTNGWMVR